MLKGMVIASDDAQELEEKLSEYGLAYVRAVSGDPGGFANAAVAFGIEPSELMAIVETDKDEKAALDAGMCCVGCLKGRMPEAALWRCHALISGYADADIGFLIDVHTRFQGLPVIIASTGRLIIREMTLDDPWEPDREKSLSYIKYMYGLYGFGMWTIEEKISGRTVGRAGFCLPQYGDVQGGVEIGYYIEEPYRRHGYALEACRAVLSYADERLGIEKVCAYIEEGNAASAGLALKLGFSYNERLDLPGKRIDVYVRKRGEEFI